MNAPERIFRVSDHAGYHNEGIPWRVIAPHERQARSNHYQSLERLHERGGLSWCEACAILEDRDWERMDSAEAKRRVLAIVEAKTDTPYNGCPFDSRLARTPYLVLPKLAIQVMPMEWRMRFDAMLAEMGALGIETPAYHVFRDDGPGEPFTRASVVNEATGFVRLVKGEEDPWADYRHMQHEKVAALCPKYRMPEAPDAIR